MEFPEPGVIDAALDEKEFPAFAEVTYDPPTPELDDVPAEARRAVGSLPLDRLPEGATVAVGLGSRGIHDIRPIARTVVDELLQRGYDPVVIPAMGSHGGATAEGQQRTLASLGLTEGALGCPVDARMSTTSLGTTDQGNEVWFSSAALEADGIVVVNRIKAHTNFSGPFESGVTKMTAIGLGKQDGAQAIHDTALTEGYVETLESTLELIQERAPLVGGVGIVENFYDRTAHVEGIPAADLPEAEEPLLEKANEYMPTLPFEELDVLVVEEIGKDISGAGMDTNVVGRYQVLNTDDPESPSIDRIVVLGLTDATHGNGQGIGLADITTAETVSELDLDQVYTNALTSSSLSKARLPVVLPTPRHALTTAAATIGAYDPGEARIAWIEDTAHLSRFRVSEALFDDADDVLDVEEWQTLTFDGGEPAFRPVRE